MKNTYKVIDGWGKQINNKKQAFRNLQHSVNLIRIMVRNNPLKRKISYV